MRNEYEHNYKNGWLDIVLVLAIVYLASNEIDGWGWVLVILWFKTLFNL